MNLSSVTLLEGDCRTVVDDAGIASCASMITDPPYRRAVHEKATSHGHKRGARHRDLGFGHLTPELRAWTCRAAALVRRWSIIYSDMESIGLWRRGLQNAGATYVRAIPWVRWSMPQLSGDRPPTGAEAIVVAWGSQRGRKGWNGPGNLTHFAQKCLRGEDKHKAEKPLDQVLELVEFFSGQGDVVFDPFTGSGTVGVACQLLDRRYVGIEQNAGWAERARARLAADELSERDQERVDRYVQAKALRTTEVAR